MITWVNDPNFKAMAVVKSFKPHGWMDGTESALRNNHVKASVNFIMK